LTFLIIGSFEKLEVIEKKVDKLAEILYIQQSEESPF